MRHMTGQEHTECNACVCNVSNIPSHNVHSMLTKNIIIIDYALHSIRHSFYWEMPNVHDSPDIFHACMNFKGAGHETSFQ